MEKSHVIGRVFVPTNQQTTKAIHPRMNPLHDPPSCFETRFLLDGFGFFLTLADMGGKAKFAKGIAYFPVVVALVQTHALRMLFCWLWTVDDDALKSAAD